MQLLPSNWSYEKSIYVLNLMDIQRGGIIVVIHEGRISMKTFIAVVVKIKTQDDVTEKVSTLIVDAEIGGKILNIFTLVFNSA